MSEMLVTSQSKEPLMVFLQKTLIFLPIHLATGSGELTLTKCDRSLLKSICYTWQLLSPTPNQPHTSRARWRPQWSSILVTYKIHACIKTEGVSEQDSRTAGRRGGVSPAGWKKKLNLCFYDWFWRNEDLHNVLVTSWAQGTHKIAHNVHGNHVMWWYYYICTAWNQMSHNVTYYIIYNIGSIMWLNIPYIEKYTLFGRRGESGQSLNKKYEGISDFPVPTPPW